MDNNIDPGPETLLERLLLASRELTATFEPGTMEAREGPGYGLLIETICRATGAPAGILWMAEGSGGAFPDIPGKQPVSLATRGTHGFREAVEAVISLDPGSTLPLAWVARTLAPITVRDLREETAGGELSELAGREGLRAMTVLPLYSRGRLLGAATIFWPDPGSCRDGACAELIASQAAATLDLAALEREVSRVNGLKDEFLSTLSHELRNPLNLIVGYTDILTLSPEAKESSMVRQACEIIRRSALAQAQLISDLLDLSRLQTGKLGIDRKLVPLSQLVADAVETVRGDARAKDISLTLERPPELLTVHADPVRVQQIAWNLLNNAIKFTPARGRITVRLAKEEREARLEVEDSGQGIDPDFLPQVFETFRQADGSPARRQGGMGIGLCLVRQLAEVHGGRALAASDGPGMGARFTVWLPLHRGIYRSASEAPSSSSGALAYRRVLVVDDSRETVNVLRSLLELEGARVETAVSGAEALRIAEALEFDLVLSDIAMPDMDGYLLLRELRSRPRTARVPAIAMTGFGQSKDIEMARQAGFFAHLTKPASLSTLLKVARAALARN